MYNCTYTQLSKNNNQYTSTYKTLQKFILFKDFLHSALHWVPGGEKIRYRWFASLQTIFYDFHPSPDWAQTEVFAAAE